MFRLTHPLPRECYVACSGGVDSMVALHWLAQKKDRVLGAVYVHHGTGEFADDSEALVRNYCELSGINFSVYPVKGKPPEHCSKEEWWREQRYNIFQNQVGCSEPIVLAHHLDDCLEEYLMCSLVRGFEGTIPYSNGRCIRPFRKWKRRDIVEYARMNGLVWVDDPSNSNVKYKRNMIRHLLVPTILNGINPGVYKIVERLIDKQDAKDERNSKNQTT